MLTILNPVYFLPIYFQADKGQTAIQSGVSTFSLSFTIAPLAIIAGISVGVTGHYKLQNHIGWALASIGMGLMTLIKWDSGKAVWVGLWVFTHSLSLALESSELTKNE